MIFKKKIRNERIPLLLTGTIDSSVYNNVGNVITDINERKIQYETSIEKYICLTPFNEIVFIENSNYPFDSIRFQKLANKYGKKFEFINGTVCKNEVIKYGKSYGDAYLIKEALEKSKLLADVLYFYKITGRIFLKNSKQICRTRNKYRNEFIVYEGKKWCLTNIFKCNREDYLQHFLNAYKVCDEKKLKDIEYVFFDCLEESNIEVQSFTVFPYFDGVMGAIGKSYSGDFKKRLIKNIIASLHGFKKGSIVSKLLSYFD